MKNERGQEADHLGDGAYVTHEGDRLVLTANHHDPERATDTVYLGLTAALNLFLFIKRTDPGLWKKIKQE